MAILKPILWWCLFDIVIAIIFMAIGFFTKNVLSIIASGVLGLSGLTKLIFTALNR